MDTDQIQDFNPPGEGEPAIDLLRPQSSHHTYVLNYLMERIRASESAMSKFYDRWSYAEKRTQAYINVSDYEKLLKEVNDKRGPVSITSVTVPYTFSTIQSIVTYLVHVFCGRKPMFSVGTYKGDQAAARMMELALQYNCDHVRLIKQLFQYFNDGELYGVGILKTQWRQKRAMRTVWKAQRPQLFGLDLPWGQPTRVRSKEMRIVFEGTDVTAIDPFMFFPDPRVPMQEVSRKGEFVAWRSFEGKLNLLKAEEEGLVSWVRDIPKGVSSQYNGSSSRGSLSGGDSHAGSRDAAYVNHSLKDAIQVDQISIEIIPRKLGLGMSESPEKWLFSIGNKGQIIQAEPLDADHGQHPVAIIEPYTLGYGFGQPGISDYLGPMQDSISWFINSHIHNVRSALNNMFIVDPSMVEMQDLKNPEPGKLIRLKKAAYGQDVRQVFQQLQVQDITRSHVTDLDLFIRMGDTLSAVNDNIRGVQDSGGRKTATEVRASGESAASRLAAHAKLISSQGITDLAEQMAINMQQNLSEEFMVQVIGPKGVMELQKVIPEMLVGDFHFPVNDGTLPLDRVAMLDVWKELYLGIAQDPQLRQQYNMTGLFEFIAELGGAQNLERFRMDIVPDQVQQQQIQAGNALPLDQALQGLGQGPAARAV